MIQILHSFRVTALGAAFSTFVACSGRGPNAASATAPARPPAASAAQEVVGKASDSLAWLAVDSAARIATLELEVTSRPGAPSAVINGSRAGELRIVVPLGWTVKWNWHSADSTAPHSLVVMVQREKVPLEGGRASFSNAMTRMVTEGLPAGQSDQSTFVAEEAGWYWMLCGVPSHAINGEWLELRVDPDAKTAGVVLKKKA